MNDLKEFQHGSEGTHWTCTNRLNKEGGQAKCCQCNPHLNCSGEKNKKLSNKQKLVIERLKQIPRNKKISIG